MKRFAVIMAGGLGSRFWPKSTEKSPKNFIHLTGDGTMIQNTFERTKKLFPIEDIYFVVNDAYANLLKEQIPEIPVNNILVEPFGRSTAPALGLVYSALSSKYSQDTIMVAFPSDQVIHNFGEFSNSIDLACETAAITKGFVTIGITPTRPETQFGYIQVDEDRQELARLYDDGVRHCKTFAEKPDAATASRFIESGDFVWNSGIFILSMDSFRQAFEKYLPFYFEQFMNLRNFVSQEKFNEELERIYKMLNPISIDYGILEKADNVYVVQASFSWTDLGTWDELYRISLKDAKDNVIHGDILSMNTSGSLVISGGRMISIIGMNDVVVVDSDDSLLICKRGQTDKVQDLVDLMRKKQIKVY